MRAKIAFIRYLPAMLTVIYCSTPAFAQTLCKPVLDCAQKAATSAAEAKAAVKILSDRLTAYQNEEQAGSQAVQTGRNGARGHVDFNRPFQAPPLIYFSKVGHSDEEIVYSAYNVTSTGFDFLIMRINSGDWSGPQQINWLALAGKR